MTTIHEENGVDLYELKMDNKLMGYGVADSEYSHYRLTFRGLENRVSVSVDAEWSDDRPGQLAAYTASTDMTCVECGPADTLAISDSGLLSVFMRVSAASSVDFRQGFTVQLPAAFVPLVRRAIELARVQAAGQ